jgi:hypothetical protein
LAGNPKVTRQLHAAGTGEEKGRTSGKNSGTGGNAEQKLCEESRMAVQGRLFAILMPANSQPTINGLAHCPESA